MAGLYEIYKDKKGEHRFRLKASNGQTILVICFAIGLRERDRIGSEKLGARSPVRA